MSNRQLIISPAARNDLIDIYRFSLQKWGQNQSSGYLEKIKEQFRTLTKLPYIGTERHELLPEVRSFPVESHVIFYRIRPTRIEIIRLLHGRQDPIKHLRKL